MKRAKKIILVFILVMPICNVYSQGEVNITLEQAYSLSLQNNHTIKQIEAVIQEKKYTQNAQRALYLPSVGLSANYIAMSHDITLDLNPVKDAITPLYSTLGSYGVFSDVPTGIPQMPYLNQDMSTAAVRKQITEGLTELEESNWNQVIQESDFGKLDVTFQWVLYAGGKITSANKIASLQKKESEIQLEQTKGDVFCNIVMQYYGLQLAREVADVRNSFFMGMSKHVADALKLKNQGIISEAEYLHAQIYESEAQREYSKSLYTSQLLQTVLMQSLAVDSIKYCKPVSPLFIIDTLQPIDYYFNTVKKQNATLEIIKNKYEQANQNYKIQKSNYLPTITALGTYDLANYQLSETMPEWLVGMGMQWTIFDGMARYNKMQSAKLKTVQVNEALQEIDSKLSIAIQKTYNELLLLQEQMKSIEVSENFAREFVRIQEKAFNEGIITSTDLVDARLNQTKVAVEKLRTMYEFDVNLAILLNYVGEVNKFYTYHKN